MRLYGAWLVEYQLRSPGGGTGASSMQMLTSAVSLFETGVLFDRGSNRPLPLRPVTPCPPAPRSAANPKPILASVETHSAAIGKPTEIERKGACAEARAPFLRSISGRADGLR